MRNLSRWSITTGKARCLKKLESWGNRKWRWPGNRDWGFLRKSGRRKLKLSIETSLKMTGSGTYAARILNSSRNKMRTIQLIRNKPFPRNHWGSKEKSWWIRFQRQKSSLCSPRLSFLLFLSVDLEKRFNTNCCYLHWVIGGRYLTKFVTNDLHNLSKDSSY